MGRKSSAPRGGNRTAQQKVLAEPVNKYSAERRARQAWRSEVQGYRTFDESRAEAERMRRAGWCFAAAWALAVAVMGVGMALFGWGC